MGVCILRGFCIFPKVEKINLSLQNSLEQKRAKLFWEMRDKQARKPYQRFVLTCKGIFFDERIQRVV